MNELRTCPGCGREFAEDETVCPLCGASAVDGAPMEAPSFAEGVAGDVEVPVAEEVKPRKKAIVFVPIAVACAVVLGLAAWLVPGLLGNPRDAFLRQHKAMIGEMMKNELSFAANLGETKEYDLDATLTAKADDVDLGLLEGGAIRLQMDVDENRLATDGSLLMQDQPVLSGALRCEFEADTMNMGFYLPELSDKYYVLDYLDMVETLTGETISPDVWRSTADTHAARDRVVKTYGDILLNTVKKSNVTKEKGTFPEFCIDGWEKTATAYVFRPTAEDLETLFLNLADALERDEDLPKLVSAFDEETRERIVPGLRRDAAELAQSMAESGFSWSIRVNGRGFYQGELCWNDGTQKCWVRYEYIRSNRDRTATTLYFGFFDGSEPAELRVVLHDGTPESAGRDIAVELVGVGSIQGQARFDQVSALRIPYGKYVITDGEGHYAADLEVKAAENGGTDHRLELYSYDGDGAYENKMVFNLYTTDAPVTLADPDAPVEDVTNYTPEDWEALGEELSQNFYSVLLGIVFLSNSNG